MVASPHEPELADKPLELGRLDKKIRRGRFAASFDRLLQVDSRHVNLFLTREMAVHLLKAAQRLPGNPYSHRAAVHLEHEDFGLIAGSQKACLLEPDTRAPSVGSGDPKVLVPRFVRQQRIIECPPAGVKAGGGARFLGCNSRAPFPSLRLALRLMSAGETATVEPVPPGQGAEHMSVFDDHREELEHYETMMGRHRGRLAVSLDLVTNALVLVGQHGVYCRSTRDPEQPAIDIGLITQELGKAKALIQSVMEGLKEETENRRS
jgi:hypothetical protein